MESSRHATPNELLRRQRQQRGWSLQRVADEIRRLCELEGRHVGITAHMVGTWERGNKRPSPLYREKLCTLYREPAERLGLLETAPEPVGLRHLHALQDSQSAPVDSALLDDLLRPEPPNTPVTSGTHAPAEHAPADGMASQPGPAAAQQLDPRGGDMRRRTFLQTVASATGAALAAPSLVMLGDEPWARLSTALARPRAVDAATVRDLEVIGASYAQLTTQIAPERLLGPVLAHLRTVTDLLQGGRQPDHLRKRLCTVAGDAAQLGGWLLFDGRDASSARTYFEVSLDAARQAGNRELSAYVLGSMSFLPNALDRPRDALRLLEQAERVAGRDSSARVRSWLSAVAAETHAILGDARATRSALDRADDAMVVAESQDSPTWIRYFDRSFLDGFHGVCHVMLQRPKAAQAALEQAIGRLAPAESKHRPVLLVDLGSAFVQQREPAVACELAVEACDLIMCATTEQRIRSLRAQLEPWRRTEPVRRLDERIHALAV